MFGLPNVGLIGSLVASLALAGLTSKCAVDAQRDKAAAESIARKAEKRADKAETGLRTCQVSLEGVTAAVEAQNGAIEKLRIDSEARVRRAQGAAKAAQASAKGYRATADMLARATPGADRCESARQLIITTLAKERQ